jgi:hypothetical protein
MALKVGMVVARFDRFDAGEEAAKTKMDRAVHLVTSHRGVSQIE